MPKNIIRVEKLTKRFRGFTAVNQISFNVKQGEIFGFLGPNGAGKSTTINMLSTLLSPTSGRARVNNYDVVSKKYEVRRSIGLVFQDSSLDDRLTAEENLRFHARLYGVPKADYEKRYREVLKLVDLWTRRQDIIKKFSGGMKRRLEIARGLIHYPAVLFLDEPSLGLDPQTRAYLWKYILKLKEDKKMTIFMTTHYMNEAEYCDRIGVIDYGKIVALDTPHNLKKMIGKDIISIRTSEEDKLKKELYQFKKLKFKQENGMFLITSENGEIFLPKLLKKVKAQIKSVELRQPTLDDVFLHLTGRKIREEEASKKDWMRERMKMRSH